MLPPFSTPPTRYRMVQTTAVHAHFENGHHGQFFYNLSLYFLFCLHDDVFYNVRFFAHLPFENLQRFKIRLYFSYVMLANLNVVNFVLKSICTLFAKCSYTV